MKYMPVFASNVRLTSETRNSLAPPAAARPYFLSGLATASVGSQRFIVH